jgi:hypothetical protein
MPHIPFSLTPNEAELLIEGLNKMIDQDFARLETAEHGPLCDGSSPDEPESAEDICVILMELSDLRDKVATQLPTGNTQ